MFINTNSVNVCQNSVFAKLSGCQNEIFEKKTAIFVFVFLCCCKRNRKKKETKWKKAKKPIKLVFKVVIQKWEKWKNIILAKLPDTICVRKGEKNAQFRAHYLLPIFFGPKQWKSGKTIKIAVSAEMAQNQKWHLFLKKVLFLTRVKI